MGKIFLLKVNFFSCILSLLNQFEMKKLIFENVECWYVMFIRQYWIEYWMPNEYLWIILPLKYLFIFLFFGNRNVKKKYRNIPMHNFVDDLFSLENCFHQIFNTVSNCKFLFGSMFAHYEKWSCILESGIINFVEKFRQGCHKIKLS